MAVQAQYPSNAFSPDFPSSRIQNNLLDELQMIQGGRDASHHLLGALNHGVDPLAFAFAFNSNNNDTVFSNPQSELTCIASGSKKRIRDDSPAMNGFAYPSLTRPVAADPSVVDQARLVESAGTSTSGRCAASSSPIAHDLVARLYHQSAEIDALIRLQNERLRLGLEQAQKRHCRALISALDQQAMKKLKEKDAELENASRRNAELEEKVRQMSAENQIWFNVAKNNEAIASSLRTSLEQVLLQSSTVNAVQSKEGYGDSDGTPFPADDARSCCFGGEEERTNGAVKTATAEARDCRKRCRVCCEKDVSVLLLPCRHLCLCKDCESKVDTCPICHVNKKGCLQIFMS